MIFNAHTEHQSNKVRPVILLHFFVAPFILFIMLRMYRAVCVKHFVRSKRCWSIRIDKKVFVPTVALLLM